MAKKYFVWNYLLGKYKLFIDAYKYLNKDEQKVY